MLETGEVIPFETLQLQYQLAESQRYRYLQLQHTLMKYKDILQHLEDKTLLEYRLLSARMQRHMISQIYRTQFANSRPHLAELKERWEAYLGRLEDGGWEEACRYPGEVAIWAGFRPIQLKI